MVEHEYEPDGTVSRLADAAGLSDAVVRKRYQDMIDELSLDARVTDYLHVLARRRLIDELRKEAQFMH